MNTLSTLTRITLPTTLKFVESDTDWSVYVDADGEEYYLAHGTGIVLVEFDLLDIDTLWAAYRMAGRSNQDDFLEDLRGMTTEPDEVDEIRFCGDCSNEAPVPYDDLYSTHDGHQVCESCINNYWFCNDCEERFNETQTTLSGTEACERCIERNWTYCEWCEGYRRDDDWGHDHNDAENCDCEAPSQQFAVRNDGEGPLANDTRASITLPAGVISAEGLEEVSCYLRSTAWDLSIEDRDKMFSLANTVIETLGEKWQTKEGNYTKRLSRLAYKTLKLKVSPEVLSHVGNIASAHSSAVAFEIEVTRDLNQSAEEFAHDGSCWWTDHAESRCALKSNGGFGLRTFGTVSSYYGNDYQGVNGRAWVQPLKLNANGGLSPTFRTQTADAFVVFNGYGDLEGYAPARIMSHMAGMTYRKISFEIEPMYVNNSSGYLLASEEIAQRYTDGSLYLSVDQHAHLNDHNDEKVLANV